MTPGFHLDLVAHLPQLRRYAISLTRNMSAGDDLLQQTALKAWKAQDLFEPGTNFKAWLFRILRNEFLMSIRQAKRTPVSLDQVADVLLGRETDHDAKIMLRQTMKSVELLPTAQREVLMLSCANGLSYEEIAVVVGCSVSAVKTRLHRARVQVFRLVMSADNSPGIPANRDQSGRDS